MLTRDQKKEAVKNLEEKFDNSNSVFLLDYKGTNVHDVTRLRKELHTFKGEFKVVKNRLVKRALEKHPKIQESFSDLEGTNAVVFSYEGDLDVVKAIKKYLKDVETLKYKKGMFKGESLDEKKFNILAELPAKEVLQAQLLGTLQGPLSKFVRVLNEAPSSFVRLLQAYKQKNEK